MSFLSGFVQQMNTISERNARFREEERDRAERREAFMKKIIADQKNVLIPYILERQAEVQNFEREEKAKQAFLIRQGLSPSTVAALTLSGQDDQVIATVQKAIQDNKYDREFASDLDTFVTTKIKESGIDPDKLGSMLSEGLYGVDATTEEGRAMGVTQALMSLMDTDEPFKVAEDMVANIISREQVRSDAPAVSLPGINLSAAVELSTTERDRIKKTLANTVAAQIAPESYVRNPVSNFPEYSGGNKAVDDIVAKMFEEVISAGRGVGSTMGLSTAITEAETKFRSIYDRLGSSEEIQKAYGIPFVDSPPTDSTSTSTGSGTGGADGASAVEQATDPYKTYYQGQGSN